MLHRTSPLGQASFQGGIMSRLIGDKDSADFYKRLGNIANSARLASAFQEGPIRGLREGLDIGVKKLMGSTLRGTGGAFNALSGGLIGLFGRAFKSVGHAAGGEDLGAVLGESIGGAVPKASLLSRGLGVINSTLSATGRIGSAAMDALAAGMNGVARRGVLVAGIAGGLVGLLSSAAGIDLRSITSRIMNVQSFATGASDLSKQKGTGIGTADVASAKALQKSMDRMGASVQVLWAQIGAAVAPIVTKSLDGISRLIQGTARWAQANRPLIASLFEITTRIFGIATVATITSKAVGVLAGTLTALTGGPLTMAATALAIGAGLWLLWSESGHKAITWVQENFGGLLKTFDQSWTGIINAIGSGRLELAAKIAWTGVKLSFLEMLKGLGGSWNDFQKIWFKSIYVVGDVWDNVFARIKRGWLGAQTFLAKGIAILLGVLEGKTAAQRQQVIDELNKEDKAGGAKIEKERADSVAKRQKQLEEDLAKLGGGDQGEIDRLRSQLNSLTAQAKLGADSPLKDFSLEKTKQGINPVGTFSANAVRGLAGGGPLDKIQENTKQTAVAIKKLEQKYKPNRMVFG
jgi:hypothetical protein